MDRGGTNGIEVNSVTIIDSQNVDFVVSQAVGFDAGKNIIVHQTWFY